jgi:hypothetical protein
LREGGGERRWFEVRLREKDLAQEIERLAHVCVGVWGRTDLLSRFQPVKEDLKAVTFLNCNCISPEGPGRRLIEEIEFSFLLERAHGAAEGA